MSIQTSDILKLRPRADCHIPRLANVPSLYAVEIDINGQTS